MCLMHHQSSALCPLSKQAFALAALAALKERPSLEISLSTEETQTLWLLVGRDMVSSNSSIIGCDKGLAC